MRVRRFQIIKLNNVTFSKKLRINTASTKYVLLWSNDIKWKELKFGETAFKENHCKYLNCYITKDRNLIDGDYRNFDAILINGKTLPQEENNVEANTTYPSKRNKKQLYVYTMRESAGDYPVCNKRFDNYFNLTWTYKLDSDIVWAYFTILNIEDKVIGPHKNINWRMKTKKVDKYKILNHKKYAALWVISDNYTLNKGETAANDIKRELTETYNLKVDYFRDCVENTHKCKTQNINIAEYYFYFAFENSIAEDYVTNTVMDALLHDSVPVVFGGAKYIRFLPPNSYIDARYQPPRIVASIIAYLIKNQSAYLDYFQWQKNYKYSTQTSAVCELCESLNMRDRTRVIKKFRKWWNPRYRSVCKKKLFEELKPIDDSLLVDSGSTSDGNAIKDLLIDNLMNRPEIREEDARKPVYKF